MPNDPHLDVRGLSVRYGLAPPALMDVSIQVPVGGVVALLGSNGAGKTTFLRALGGLLPFHGGRITQGEIRLEGDLVDRTSPAKLVRRGLAQVMEGRRIFAELSVEDNLNAGAVTAQNRQQTEVVKAGILETFPVLAERLNARAGYLSGGEQQMLAIARALMSSPKLLLMDEPSLGLAPRIVERIAEIVVNLNRSGTSVLLVEQNAAMALSTADYAYVMQNGRLLLHGPVDELRDAPEVRDLYLGRTSGGEGSVGEPPAAPAAAAQPAAPSGPLVAPEKLPAVAPPQSDAPPLLEIEGVSLSFSGVLALSEVSFKVRKGELLALIGPNGAGKTSVFNCISGVYRPQRGAIHLEGRSLIGLRPFRVAASGVARTFQNLGLFETLDVMENLMLGRHVRMKSGFLAGSVWFGRARREEVVNRRHCAELVELLDLHPYVGRPVGLLPYGVQKRIEIGRALAAEPRLLLLDEPVAGMTGEESEHAAELLGRIRTEMGLTILLVEHHLSLVMRTADRVAAMNFGAVIASGTPEEVAAHPAVVEAYLGAAGDAAAQPTQATQPVRPTRQIPGDPAGPADPAELGRARPD